MSKDNSQTNIYDEVKSHAIYEMLTKNLDEAQRNALDDVIKEFSHHMQANVFGPAMETVMKARAAAAQQAASVARALPAGTGGWRRRRSRGSW